MIGRATMSGKRLYEFSARLLSGELVGLDRYRGKVLLIENVASLWGTTERDYRQLNQLQSEYGARGLQVLGFPCNQFGHQENSGNQEILNVLKFVRPGGGFVPGFPLFEKCEVNGEKEHPLFTYLKEALPYPSDDPASFMTDPKSIIWSPVRRSDIAWNFEKFLIGADGAPFRRYSRRFATIDLRSDIEELLGHAPLQKPM